MLAAAPEPAGAGPTRGSSRPGRRAAEDTRDRPASSRRPGVPAPGCTSCTCPAPTRCRALAAARADGVRVTRRDLPALPGARGRGGARRRDRSSSAARRSASAANRDALWAALADGDHRPGGQRPLAVHARPQGAGHRRLRRGLGRHLVGAARPAAGLDRGAPARPRPGRRGALDVGGARRALVGLGSKGGDRGSARTPTWWPSPRTTTSWSTRPGCTTATRSRPYAGARLTGRGAPTWLRWAALVGTCGATARPAAGRGEA